MSTTSITRTLPSIPLLTIEDCMSMREATAVSGVRTHKIRASFDSRSLFNAARRDGEERWLILGIAMSATRS